ncbi:hypothetical protein [Staphylococcus sp. 11261D007BR]
MRNKEPEVIDPDDPRYRHPDDFNRQRNNQYEHHRPQGGRFYYKSVGCTPIGCFPGCLFSIIISIILTFLLNMLFW